MIGYFMRNLLTTAFLAPSFPNSAARSRLPLQKVQGEVPLEVEEEAHAPPPAQAPENAPARAVKRHHRLWRAGGCLAEG